MRLTPNASSSVGIAFIFATTAAPLLRAAATPTAATATYKSQDTLGNCYSRQVTSAARAVTAVTDVTVCPTKR